MVIDELSPSQTAIPSSRILVVTKSDSITAPVMEYAINVAERLKCKLLAAYVNTQPLLWNDNEQSMIFASAIRENVAIFKEKAGKRGVDLAHVQENGRIEKVISRLCHIAKRIEFVVIDRGIRLEEATAGSPVPVFHVACGEQEALPPREQNNQTRFSTPSALGTIPRKHPVKGRLLLTGIALAAIDAAALWLVAYPRYSPDIGGVPQALPAVALLALGAAHAVFAGRIILARQDKRRDDAANLRQQSGSIRPIRKPKRRAASSRTSPGQ